MFLVSDPKDMIYIEEENCRYFRACTQDIDLKLCWSYFTQNYHCYVVHSEDVDLNEELSSGFYIIQFSFKELEHLKHKKKMFTIYKKRACYISSNCYEYVSDQAGFAIFIIKNSVFDLYYHDIENRFTNNIKIPIGHEMVNGYEVKLVNATIWIVTRINDECFVLSMQFVSKMRRNGITLQLHQRL